MPIGHNLFDGLGEALFGLPQVKDHRAPVQLTSTFTNTAVITTTAVGDDPGNNSSDAGVMVMAGGTVETATGTGTATGG